MGKIVFFRPIGSAGHGHLGSPLTVTRDTSHILRLLMSLCAFHAVFLSLMPVLIFTVSGISSTLININTNINERDALTHAFET